MGCAPSGIECLPERARLKPSSIPFLYRRHARSEQAFWTERYGSAIFRLSTGGSERPSTRARSKKERVDSQSGAINAKVDAKAKTTVTREQAEKKRKEEKRYKENKNYVMVG
jgi:hypothetical protein